MAGTCLRVAQHSASCCLVPFPNVPHAYAWPPPKDSEILESKASPAPLPLPPHPRLSLAQDVLHKHSPRPLGQGKGRHG